MGAIKFSLAQVLNELFFGNSGSKKTIASGYGSPPSDSVMISRLSKVSRQPLRILTDVSLGDPVTVNSERQNDIGSGVWSRVTNGTYRYTLAGAFKGIVLEKNYGGQLGSWMTLMKADDDSVEIKTYDPIDGSLGDDLFSGEIAIEVIQLITE